MEDDNLKTSKCCCFEVEVDDDPINKEDVEDCCEMPCCLCTPCKDSPVLDNPVCNLLRKSDGIRLILGCLVGFILGNLLTLVRPVSPGSRFCMGGNFNAFTDSPCHTYGIAPDSSFNITQNDIEILSKQLNLCLDSTCTKSYTVPNMHQDDIKICYVNHADKYFVSVGDCANLDSISEFMSNTVKTQFYVTAGPEMGSTLCLNVNPNDRTATLNGRNSACPSGDYGFTAFTEDAKTSTIKQNEYSKNKNEYDQIIDYVFAFPGKLWLNSLKLVVVPLLIANIITSTSDLTEIPNAGKLGCYTFLYYFTTTIIAAVESLILCAIILVPFLKQFAPAQNPYKAPSKPYQDTGAQITGVINSIVPKNIVKAVVGDPNTNFLGIIFFCILIGIALPRKGKNGLPGVFLLWFRELNDMMFKIIHVIILLTPLGIFLIQTNVYASHDIADVLTKVSLFLTTVFMGLGLHLFIVYPALYFLLTRKNPYTFMWNLKDAMLTALAISSSIATLPVTLKCARKNKIREEIAKFVLSLGATINMDGTTIGFPCAVIFVAFGEGVPLHFGQMIMIVLLSTVSSMGAAPIPQAGLVLLVLILDNFGIPQEGVFGYIIAVDWLYDRPETMVNIVGDSYAAGIMDHYLGQQFRRISMMEKKSNASTEQLNNTEP